jgi:flavin reductase (DIM6/NTAB) family NADH-FMN oxidoreductase RutF
MQNEISEFFRTLAHGVYFVGVGDHGRQHAFAPATVMLASRRPPLLAAAISPRHASYPLVRTGRVFTVSVLRQEQFDRARGGGAQSARDPDKPNGISWRRVRSGAPVLEDALACFECEMSAVMPAGDRQIVLGRIVDWHVAGRHRVATTPHAVEPERSRMLFSGNSPAP